MTLTDKLLLLNALLAMLPLSSPTAGELHDNIDALMTDIKPDLPAGYQPRFEAIRASLFNEPEPSE